MQHPGFDDFMNDLKDNQKGSNSARADFFKLKNGDNRVVILTNPVGYSEVFKIGIAYEDCGYGAYAGRRYKCYVKDLEDDKIKTANFSYTTAKKIAALSEGARTKFTEFPIPYVVNLRTVNAGTKEVDTSVIADEDYEVTEEDKAELASFDSITEIIERLKVAQKKKVESSPELRAQIDAFISEKEKEAEDYKQKKEKDSTFQDKSKDLDTIEYPEEEINIEDIPF